MEENALKYPFATQVVSEFEYATECPLCGPDCMYYLRDNLCKMRDDKDLYSLDLGYCIEELWKHLCNPIYDYRFPPKEDFMLSEIKSKIINRRSFDYFDQKFKRYVRRVRIKIALDEVDSEPDPYQGRSFHSKTVRKLLSLTGSSSYSLADIVSFIAPRYVGDPGVNRENFDYPCDEKVHVSYIPCEYKTPLSFFIVSFFRGAFTCPLRYEFSESECYCIYDNLLRMKRQTPPEELGKLRVIDAALIEYEESKGSKLKKKHKKHMDEIQKFFKKNRDLTSKEYEKRRNCIYCGINVYVPICITCSRNSYSNSTDLYEAFRDQRYDSGQKEEARDILSITDPKEYKFYYGRQWETTKNGIKYTAALANRYPLAADLVNEFSGTSTCELCDSGRETTCYHFLYHNMMRMREQTPLDDTEKHAKLDLAFEQYLNNERLYFRCQRQMHDGVESAPSSHTHFPCAGSWLVSSLF
jgi:hypothetical protein